MHWGAEGAMGGANQRRPGWAGSGATAGASNVLAQRAQRVWQRQPLAHAHGCCYNQLQNTSCSHDDLSIQARAEVRRPARPLVCTDCSLTLNEQQQHWCFSCQAIMSRRGHAYGSISWIHGITPHTEPPAAAWQPSQQVRACLPLSRRPQRSQLIKLGAAYCSAASKPHMCLWPSFQASRWQAAEQ